MNTSDVYVETAEQAAALFQHFVREASIDLRCQNVTLNAIANWSQIATGSLLKETLRAA